MQRIENTYASATLPSLSSTGTVGYFTGGNTTLGVPPTNVTADWLNGIQEELIYCITLTGGTPTLGTNTQLATAIDYLSSYFNAPFTGTLSSAMAIDYSSGGRISVSTGSLIQFFNGGLGTTEIARFDTSGNLCIGTTSAMAKLTVAGPISLQKPSTTITATTYSVAASDNVLIFNTTAACTITLPTASTNTGRILYIVNKAAFALNSATSNVYPPATLTLGAVIAAATAGTLVKLISDGTNWWSF